jgi:hypothetical protein
MDHPFTWLHEHLDAMRNQKDSHGKPIDLLGIVQEIFQLSSRQTSARLINDIDSNWPILQNEEARWRRTPNPDVIAGEQNAHDPIVNMHNLTAAWNNFLAAAGGPGIPVMITVLHKLTDALNGMQEAIIRHPRIASDLFYLVGALGALTALGGSLVILNATWAPLIGGLRMLTGLGALDATGVGLGAIATGIAGLAAPVVALGAAFNGLPKFLKWAADQVVPDNEKKPGANLRSGLGGSALHGAPIPSPAQSAVQDQAATHAVGGGRGSSHANQMHSAGPPPAAEPTPVKVDTQSADSLGATIAKAVKDALVGIGVNLDGKKVGSIVANNLADQMSRPQSAPTGPDMRLGTAMPGMGLSY